MKLFSKIEIGNKPLRNRIIRSATFEGMADSGGFPLESYFEMYKNLAQQEIGAIITGFAFISKEGRAMQPGQTGIDEPDKIEHFRKITDIVHSNNGIIYKQIAHTGRQTKRKFTKHRVLGVSRKPSLYFMSIPHVLSTTEATEIIEKFAKSTLYAKQSGFDGVQLHCAHGYLIHQFLHPAINNRKDEFGLDRKSGVGTAFLEKIIDRSRELCTENYPILVKISGSDDLHKPFSEDNFIQLIKFLNRKKVAAIEISYGTMDYALSIFRGAIPLNAIFSMNPIYKTDSPILRKILMHTIIPFMKKRIKPYSSAYNLHFAELAKQYTDIPVISVGGFRTGTEMEQALQKNQTDLISLSRPFLAEVDFIEKIKEDTTHRSACINCNLCAINCDTENETKCLAGDKSWVSEKK